MIGRRFHVTTGWTSAITSSIEYKHGFFDVAAFRENMDHHRGSGVRYIGRERVQHVWDATQPS